MEEAKKNMQNILATKKQNSLEAKKGDKKVLEKKDIKKDKKVEEKKDETIEKGFLDGSKTQDEAAKKIQDQYRKKK